MSNFINRVKNALSSEPREHVNTEANQEVDSVNPTAARPGDASSQGLAGSGTVMEGTHANEQNSTMIAHPTPQSGTAGQGTAIANPMTGTGYTTTAPSIQDHHTASKPDPYIGMANTPESQFDSQGQSTSASHPSLAARDVEAGITGSDRYDTNDSKYGPTATTSGNLDTVVGPQDNTLGGMASQTDRTIPGTTEAAGSYGMDSQIERGSGVEKRFGDVETVGPNSTTTSTRLDAASVSPSVMREHLGEPEIMHGDMSHNRAGRHQSVSEQESHRGI